MRYDLHVHSNHSLCSNLEPRVILKLMEKRNLDGIAITDHNSIAGGLALKRLNKGDREIIVGSEIMTEEGGEVLAYYLQEDVAPGPLDTVIDQLREQDCLIAFAHPLDILRNHFKRSDLHGKDIDALECVNGRNLIPTNLSELSKELGYACIGGSDAHFSFEVGKVVTEFEGSLREAVKKRTTSAKGYSPLAPLGYAGTLFRKIKHSWDNRT